MSEAFIGSEAITAGRLTPYELRSRFVAIYPDVYVPKEIEVDPRLRAQACWLWSRRRGVLAGFSASALHGAKWIDPRRPAEILYDNRHTPPGIKTYRDRIAQQQEQQEQQEQQHEEVQILSGMLVTTPARTALDLARRYPIDTAVTAIDALAHATDLKLADAHALARRYRGRRGIKGAQVSLRLVDPGAESPRETWLRLLLIRAGFPRPQTQIPVYDGFGQLIARLDMGWQDILVAAEYEGDHHRTSRKQFNDDIRRLESLTELGWIVVRVTAQDTPAVIIRRVAAARERRLPAAWSG